MVAVRMTWFRAYLTPQLYPGRVAAIDWLGKYIDMSKKNTKNSNTGYLLMQTVSM
jgi:hypothetical protein